MTTGPAFKDEFVDAAMQGFKDMKLSAEETGEDTGTRADGAVGSDGAATGPRLVRPAAVQTDGPRR